MVINLEFHFCFLIERIKHDIEFQLVLDYMDLWKFKVNLWFAMPVFSLLIHWEQKKKTTLIEKKIKSSIDKKETNSAYVKFRTRNEADD